MSVTAPRPRAHAGGAMGRLRRNLAVRAGFTLGEARGRFVSQPALAAWLILASLMVAAGMMLLPDWIPPAAMLLVLLGGVLVLRRAAMVALAVAMIIETVVLASGDWVEFTPGVVVVQGVALVIGLLFVRSRELLGLQGAPSQLMLVDLRDRIAAHGRIPALPEGWRVESVVRSANGEGFSGDFVVAARGAGGPVLEIVLVDVSGKGQEAGVRSLLLSGAFGGLLGAMPPPQFLPAANAYLLEQRWPEGFATAVHLAVHLETGVYQVAAAGHPPPIHHHAGEGRLEVIRSTGGPALGVVGAPTYVAHEGRLAYGDTLLLYTDGLVEDAGRDLDLGIDRLMGVVERLVATGKGGAEEVLAELKAGEGDDRGLILVQRV
ncbi:serine/threonine-protein phosphatase [Actinotalea sp. M2MS4P-6]|uniref:PP2C family protein-serine/threonine phosphatase n=1 Tax=Actinotalea sp. M2MS4P-6 TaxID=2983762 RepID=UPI0021E3A484|nr:PP2C family protein-serine/threonine phosphatase [Actinotalea sp. M2MS4P-6]MCV2396247.1 serine/threonine-protein phosphatase [Actinotalea sp. M2MS4P-6]